MTLSRRVFTVLRAGALLAGVVFSSGYSRAQESGLEPASSAEIQQLLRVQQSETAVLFERQPYAGSARAEPGVWRAVWAGARKPCHGHHPHRDV